MTNRLDDRGFLTAHDPGGMLEIVESSLPAWTDGFARSPALPDFDVDSVCVSGMGGSGIAGDVLAALAASRSQVAVVVHKGFDLPAWVGARTLVVAVSYSGGTEETLACAQVAAHRGAPLVVVARGGALGDLARANGAPLVVPEPGGLMPRAALPALASAVLSVGARVGAVPDLDVLVAELPSVLEDALRRWGPDAVDNEAKRLAERLVSTTPAIWGQEGVLGVAAMRCKAQLNENAKMVASYNVVPEALHNEIVPASDAELIVALRAEVEREGIERRLDALEGLRVEEVLVPGSGELAVFASAALFADLVSLYCAALRGVDPTPIDAIARLKQSLG